MKYAFIFFIFIIGCTDDRSLEYEDFVANPVFEANVFEIEYTSDSINSGNNPVAPPNSALFFIEVDFLNEDFNMDNLERLEFKFLAENSINRQQSFEFVFYDMNDMETFRVSESISAGAENNPSTNRFSVELTRDEIDRFVTSQRAEILLNQPALATNDGIMLLECVVEAEFFYSSE